MTIAEQKIFKKLYDRTIKINTGSLFTVTKQSRATDGQGYLSGQTTSTVQVYGDFQQISDAVELKTLGYEQDGMAKFYTFQNSNILSGDSLSVSTTINGVLTAQNWKFIKRIDDDYLSGNVEVAQVWLLQRIDG